MGYVYFACILVWCWYGLQFLWCIYVLCAYLIGHFACACFSEPHQFISCEICVWNRKLDLKEEFSIWEFRPHCIILKFLNKFLFTLPICLLGNRGFVTGHAILWQSIYKPTSCNCPPLDNSFFKKIIPSVLSQNSKFVQ